MLQGIWAAKKEPGSFPKNGDLSFSGAAPGPFRAWKQPKEYFAPEFAVYYRGSGPPKKNPEVFRKTATLASPEPLRGRFGPGSNQKSTLRPSLLCITGDLGRQKRTRKFSENGDLSFSGAAPGPFRAWKQPKEYFAPEFAVYYRGSGPPKKNPEVFRKTATLASPEPLWGRFGPGSNQKSTLRPSLLCITGDLGRQKRTRKFSEKRRP